MNKREFKRMVNLAAQNLIDHYKYNGVCCSIVDVFHTNNPKDENWREVRRDFVAIFKPELTKVAYWLGARDKENLPRRLLALRLFEQIALDEKLYERTTNTIIFIMIN